MADASTSNLVRIATRGVRGATVASSNERSEIHGAIEELVIQVVDQNGIDPDDIGAAFFTTTPDLDASFPAEAIRTSLGWEFVPMLGAVEMAKPGAPERCIRVLLMWNTDRDPRSIQHVYLRGTESLRTAGRSEQ